MDTSEFQEHDEVEILEDMPERRVKAGMRGVVVYLRAFEIEVFDEDQNTVCVCGMRPEQVRRIGPSF